MISFVQKCRVVKYENQDAMDLTEKGWLQKYIEYRTGIDAPGFDSYDDYEKLIYKTFQPTGIMYGHPLNMPDFIVLDLNDWPVKERTKLIFTEAIISSGIIVNSCKNGAPDYQFITQIQQPVKDFYSTTGSKGFSFLSFGKNKTDLQIAESFLNKRVVVKAGWNASFWQGFFQNLLLFTDVLIMINYFNTGRLDAVKEKQENIRIKALTIMAAAAFADGEVDSSERKLFDFFVKSAELKPDRKKQIQVLLDGSPDLNSIPDFDNESWLEKKYLLELAVLTVWADRNLHRNEEEFLVKLNEKMGFNEVELHASMAAIESFVMNNWKRVHYLQSKQNYLIVSKRLTGRMSKIALKYKHEIGNEISESKELINLINKSRTSFLTVDEKAKIRQQLIDILKSVPAFVIIALPFSFLTLPILFKILPKSVFPSSFDENKIIRTNKKGFISE